MSNHCLFCNIAKKESPHHLIDENENFMAFLTIFPNTEGLQLLFLKNIIQAMHLI